MRIIRACGHKKCCSLGIHIDFKFKYVNIHFLWWMILIPNDNFAKFQEPKQEKQFIEMLNRHEKERDEFRNICGKGIILG